VEGRSFVCECGKSYLSQPALTNHKKTKHESEKQGEKRGRGRPKKSVVNSQDFIQKSEMKFKSFFEQENRLRKGNEAQDISLQVVEQVFKDLVLQYKANFLKEYNSIDDHPLFRLLKESISNPQSTPLKANPSETKKFDQVSIEYLRDVIKKTNEEYFIFAFKFVVLFRECINVLFNAENKSHKEYCEVNGAEVAPDKCNEFITEFMEKNNYFGLSSEDLKYEIIEIIQQFCFWLFENGYTSSRLSLVS